MDCAFEVLLEIFVPLVGMSGFDEVVGEAEEEGTVAGAHELFGSFRLLFAMVERLAAFTVFLAAFAGAERVFAFGWNAVRNWSHGGSLGEGRELGDQYYSDSGREFVEPSCEMICFQLLLTFMKSLRILLLCGSAALADTGSLRLIWTDKDLGKIESSDIDGGNRVTLKTGLSDPRGIVVDVSQDKIYWASHTASGTIYRANCDGTGQEVFLSSLFNPADLALDLENRMIYWAAEGDDGNPGFIQRASLDDSPTAETVLSGLNRPYYLAVDGGFIYWSDFDSGVIHRATTEGGGTAPYNFITGLSRVRDVEVADGFIYWGDRGSSDIRRRAVNGAETGEVLYSGVGLGRPHGLVLDLEGGQLYWTDTTTTSISSGSLDGVAAKGTIAATSLLGPWGIALVRPAEAGDPHGDWRRENFATEDLNDPLKEATVWGDSADPDLDGRNNLLEYAQGTDPNFTILPPGLISVVSGESVHVTFRVRADDDQLIATLEATGDLESGPWSGDMLEEIGERVPDPENDGYEFVTVEVDEGLTELFLRLRVSRE